MSPDALTRSARQIALPEIGLDGQARIAAATVVVAGDDLTCEVAARALAAAGVGRLRLVRRTGALAPEVGAAIAASNPDVALELVAWPEARTDDAGAAGADREGAGRAWLAALDGARVVVRSGFDDDPMLRAAVRLGLPAVVTRGRDSGIEVVSFRRHGPCVHAPLDLPEQAGVPPEDGAGAVVAGEIAAAEALILIAGAATGQARARHASVPLDGGGDREARAHDVPWTPECFACGGSGSEMSFA